MEVRGVIGSLLLRVVRTACCMAVFILQMADTSIAQAPSCNIKGGKIQVVIPKTIAESELDIFIRKFDLGELALKKFLREGFTDSLQANGWEIAEATGNTITLNKNLASTDLVNDPAGRIIFTGEKPWRVDLVFPVVSNTVVLGYNRFRNKPSFAIRDSIVYFHLRDNERAKTVKLAGSFNDWDPESIDMKKTDSGWVAGVKLIPGKYWYKFIIDGEWKTDGDNRLSEPDGIGNTNSVFFYTNTVFRLNGHIDSKRVYRAGSFNNWNRRDLAMEKTATGWELPVYLKDGTHTYRFIVDSRWMADPGNPDRLPNEYNEFNSVISIGTPHI